MDTSWAVNVILFNFFFNFFFFVRWKNVMNDTQQSEPFGKPYFLGNPWFFDAKSNSSGKSKSISTSTWMRHIMCQNQLSSQRYRIELWMCRGEFKFHYNINLKEAKIKSWGKLASKNLLFMSLHTLQRMRLLIVFSCFVSAKMTHTNLPAWSVN